MLLIVKGRTEEYFFHTTITFVRKFKALTLSTVAAHVAITITTTMKTDE